MRGERTQERVGRDEGVGEERQHKKSQHNDRSHQGEKKDKLGRASMIEERVVGRR